MKIHPLKTLALAMLMAFGIVACSGGGDGTGAIDNGSPTPVNPTPVDPVNPTPDPDLVNLEDFNGIYFNPETKQIALIDVDEQYQVMLQNYYDIDETDIIPHLHLVEDLEAGETEATSGATTTWTFENDKFETSGQTLSLSDDGNTLSITNADEDIAHNQNGNNPTLEKQPDSRPLSELTMNLRLDINGTTWTIEESGDFKMNLRGKCVFNGALEDSGKGYYVTENATLASGCESVGYQPGSYTTKFYSFESTFSDGTTPATYVATVSIHNNDGASQRPIFSVIAVTSRKEPIDGVYYANRKEFMGVSGVTCNKPEYCLDDGDNTNDQDNAAIDGTYGQIVFIDYYKEPYNVVIHKALAGAPNSMSEPFADVIFMKAEYAKDPLGEDDKNTLTATTYYAGPTMGLIAGLPIEKRTGNVTITLHESDAGSYVKVIIENAELFDPKNLTFGAKIPLEGVEFAYQAPVPISDLLLPDVEDRSGVVWTLNKPADDGTGRMTFGAKSPDLGEACDDNTPSVVSGTLTNEKDYYFSDDETIFSESIADQFSIDASAGMTTNLYGFVPEDGNIYLTTNVVTNDFGNLKMGIGGGLFPPTDEKDPTLCANKNNP